MFANLIGLAVPSGVNYLAQCLGHDPGPEGDRAQAAGRGLRLADRPPTPTRELGTGRIILNPDMLPETEGAHKLLRDEDFTAMQLLHLPQWVVPCACPPPPRPV